MFPSRTPQLSFNCIPVVPTSVSRPVSLSFDNIFKCVQCSTHIPCVQVYFDSGIGNDDAVPRKFVALLLLERRRDRKEVQRFLVSTLHA